MSFAFSYFFFGLAFTQAVNIVGMIYAGELIAMFYLFGNFFRIKFNDFEYKFLWFTLILITIQLISDLLNDNDFKNILRGLFAYIVFFAVIIFLRKLLKEEQGLIRLGSFLMGALLGYNVLFLTGENDYTNWLNQLYLNNPWKWGLGRSVILIIFLFGAVFRYQKEYSKKFYFFVSIILIYICFHYNARALAFIYFIALILFLVFNNSQTFNLRFFSNKYRFIFFPLLFLIFSALIGVYISSLTKLTFVKTAFPDFVRKTDLQDKGVFGAFLGGRSNFITAYYAIKDKPLLGHGSTPDDHNLNYMFKQFEFLQDYYYSDKIPNLRNISAKRGNSIYSHSFLFDSIVQAGIFGAIYWLFIIGYLTRNFTFYSNKLPLFFYFGLVNFYFVLFFEPWGAIYRMRTALFIVSLSMFVEYINEQKKIK